ncbi:MAG TPA: TonB-dependent receptor plug domain-containing protein [Novosphingobium sp.]|nr:TonB-dependent receptor plug domain-containing protein [Novosphingobium sp.]
MRTFVTLASLLAASPVLAQTSEPAPQPAPQPASDAPAAEAEQTPEEKLEETAAPGEILVVASRLRGQIEAPQAPIASFDEDEIQALGATSVADLLTKVSPQTSSGRGRGGAGGMPLVLVNGQRVTNFRELRNYPPEAIKRVEILPEEVALRYGSPPNTRVVNLILKDNFSSRRIEGSYGIPTRGGFNTWQGEATLLKIQKLNRFSVTASTSDTSPLFESERDLVQTAGNRPTVSTDPDPAANRTLISDSRNFGLNAAWTKGFGKDGTKGSFTVSAEANRSDSRGFSGLNTVLLTAPGGATALRSLPGPLERVNQTTSASAGLGYNKMLGRWQFSATVDGTHTESKSRFDRRADVSGLVAQAAAGT